MSKLVATFFFVGLMRPAPGTWGSLAALPVAWVVMQWAGYLGLMVATLLIFLAGTWATIEQTRDSEDHDPSEIVIDEVVGQWIALLPVAYGAQLMSLPALNLWPGWIAAFVLFRLFDIRKPWLVGAADRRNDPLGVMLDDVFAGLYAAVGVVVLALLYHAVAL